MLFRPSAPVAPVQTLFAQRRIAGRWLKLALAGMCLLGWVATAAGQGVGYAQQARLLGPVTEIAADSLAHVGGPAIDSAGNLYVCSGLGQLIYKIPYNGGSYGTPVTVATGIKSPSDLTLDSAGNIYFATYTDVEKIAYSGGSYGSAVVLASGFNEPSSVRLDAAGNLYVAELAPGTVKKVPYSAGSYGPPVTVGSGFSQPSGVAIDGTGNIFVADEGHNQIKVIPYNGGSYGTPVAVSADFTSINSLEGIALDGSGNIYVEDAGLLKKFTVYGGKNYGSAYIIGGASIGFFSGVVLDSAGSPYSIWYKNSGDASLVKIGPVQQAFDFGASNVGVASPMTKTLYFSIDSGGAIEPPFVMTQGSPSLDFADTGTGTCTTNGTGYGYPQAGGVCTVVVSFTPASPGVRSGAVVITGARFVSNIGGGGSGATGYQPTAQLASATLQGTGIGAQVTYPPGSSSSVSYAYSAPYGLVSNVAGNGYTNTYISQYANGKGYIAITSFTGSGGTGNTYTCGACHPQGLAVDQTGRIIFSDINDNTVKLFSAYDSQYSSTPLTVATGFYQPQGVAVDGAGNIYVADTNNSVIKKIPYTAGGLDPNVNYYDQYNYGTPVVLGSGFNYPQGVAVDGAGNVYVSDTYNNVVKKIPYSGGTYGTPVIVASGFNYPAGLVLDGGGNIYVADNGSNSVKKIPYSGGSYGTPVTLVNFVINGPVGIFIDGSGNVAVTEPAAGAIATIDLADAPKVTFPITAVGNTSASQTVTLANIGNFPLTLVPPAAGYNPSISANFTLGNASNCPQLSSMSSAATTLAAGASCTEVVSFAPTTAAIISGSLTVSDKLSIPSATTMQTVLLSGTGTPTPPTITVPAVTIAQGTVNTVLTASVAYTGSTAPTGTVTLQLQSYGQAASCTGTTSPLTCTASFFTAMASVGKYNISASIAADANYAAATSAVSLLTVTAPVVMVTVPTVTATYGATANFQANIAYSGPTPNGAVTIKVDNGASFATTCTGSTSPRTCSAYYGTNTFTAGTHTITASIAADANYAAASGMGTLTLSPSMPQITVGAAAPITYGTAATTLSVSVGYSGAAAPSGAVTFKVDNGAPVAISCPGTSSPLMCSTSYPTATLSAGNHTITASIAADAYYATVSNTAMLTVTAATPTVSVPTVTTPYGTAQTTLTGNIGFSGAAPTGAVTVKVDSGAVVAATCTGTTSPLVCTASYSTSTLAVGNHTTLFSIAADTNYTTVANGGTLTITTATPTVTVPAVTINYGTATTTLSAAIGYTGGTAPTGQVTLKVDSGSTVIAACTGSGLALNCSASYSTVALTAGAHTITAAVAVDSNYVSASNTGTLTVNAISPTVSVAAVSTIYGTATTTLSANVLYTGSTAPTGAVTFKVDGVMPVAAVCPVSAGALSCTASYPTGALTVGPHMITATIAADSNYTTASNTNTLTVNVPPDFAFTPPANLSQSVLPGGTAVFTFQLTPQNNLYPGPISFNVSGLPPGATYTVSPNSIPATGGPQTVTVTIQTAAAVALNATRSRVAPISLALFVPLLALGALRRRRGVAIMLTLLLGFLVSGAAIGCGSGSGFFRHTPQTYPVVITVTSGTVVHTINVSLTVQ